MKFEIVLKLAVEPATGTLLGKVLGHGIAHALAPFLQAQEDLIVSKLSDAIQAASDSADAAIGRVQDDVAALQAQVATLQAAVDAGGASPQDLTALQDLKDRLDALDPNKAATLPA